MDENKEQKPRYSQDEIVDYLLAVALNENLMIAAQHAAVHTDAVDWLAKQKSG